MKICLFIVFAIALSAQIVPAAQAPRLLSWIDNSDDEEGFIIEAERGNSGYVEIARIGPNQNFVTVKIQRNECYRVRAFNRWGFSTPSNQVCGRNYV